MCYGWGEGDGQLCGSGRGAIVVCYGLGGRVMTNFGGVDVVPLLGAIAGCHCRVPEERVMTNFGGVDVVPLLGAILGCHCSVLWLGAFFLYIDDTKIAFCYLGLCWYDFSKEV